MSKVIKILLSICILLIAYAVYWDLDKKCTFCNLYDKKLLYYPIDWYEDAFEQYFDNVHVTRNHMMSFNIHLVSYPGVARNIGRNLILWGKVQDVEAFNEIANRLAIAEQLYPYYQENFNDEFSDNIEFLMELKVEYNSESNQTMRYKSLSGNIYKWDKQKSIDYLYNNGYVRLVLCLLFDQQSLKEAEISFEEVNERIKTILYQDIENSEDLMIVLEVAMTDNMDNYKPYDLFVNLSALENYLQWKITSINPDWIEIKRAW